MKQRIYWNAEIRMWMPWYGCIPEPYVHPRDLIAFVNQLNILNNTRSLKP